MRVNKNEHVVYFDVDDTLVMHRKVLLEDTFVNVLDPVTDSYITLIINKPMVRLLKEEASRGACVIVWSRGGWAWAEAVVKALGLESLVDSVQTKPLVYFDDKPIDEWLIYRVYMEPETHYKK